MFVADIATIDKALAFCHSEIAWLDKKPDDWAARKARQMRDILELLGTMRRRMQMTTVGGKVLGDSE
jgi:hypothetical protein